MHEDSFDLDPTARRSRESCRLILIPGHDSSTQWKQETIQHLLVVGLVRHASLRYIGEVIVAPLMALLVGVKHLLLAVNVNLRWKGHPQGSPGLAMLLVFRTHRRCRALTESSLLVRQIIAHPIVES